jgi:Ca-activated chloride channel family protein
MLKSKLIPCRTLLRGTCVVLGLMLSNTAFAFSFEDLWFNQNQQAARLLDQQKNSEAAAKFSDNHWKGVAYYRDKKYDQALEIFKQDKTANGWYNQGNTLAQMQKYQEAIDAYTKALEIQKNFPDAEHNRELVKKLKQQQEQQNKQDQKDQKDQKKNSPENSDKKDNLADKAKQDQNQQQAQQNQATPTPTPGATPTPAAANNVNNNPQNYQDQELRAALSQIPDDPGGLLRNKFLRDYQNEQQQGGN